MLLTAPSALSLSHVLTESRQRGEEEDAGRKGGKERPRVGSLWREQLGQEGGKRPMLSRKKGKKYWGGNSYLVFKHTQENNPHISYCGKNQKENPAGLKEFWPNREK